MKPKTIVLLVIAALFLIILLQNMDETSIQLLFWTIQIPLLIQLLASIFLGWVVGWFMHATYARGKKRGSAQMQKEAVQKQRGQEPPRETSV